MIYRFGECVLDEERYELPCVCSPHRDQLYGAHEPHGKSYAKPAEAHNS